MASPPTSPAIQHLQDEERKPRSNSFGDARWRTSSFSEPGRVIVIAIDSSPNAKNAFNWYVDNMHRADDLVVLTHIPEPPHLPSFSFRGGLNVPAERWKEIMDETNAKTNKLNSDYEDDCIHKKLRYKVRGESSKHTGEAICAIASSEHADTIIIGCRGLSAMKRAMLGSVSEYVVRHAGRPVMVVPYRK